MKIYDKNKTAYDITCKRTNGEEAMPCPKCADERKKKNLKPFSWNHDKQQGYCNHCETSFYIPMIQEVKKKETYKIPQKNLTQLSEKTLNWFKSRGISQSTVMRFGITESVEFMPQVEEQRTCINFNYFRNDELVNIKFRDGQKNFKLVSGAELIFYNYDALQEYKEIIIVEGEMDCLSLYECGIYNVVSVPDGAKKSDTAKLQYLESAYELFEKMDKVILAVDNDEPGLLFREILANRIGKEKCFKVAYKETCKDFNDILLKFGESAVKECLNEIYPYPLEGIEYVNTLYDEVVDLYENGVPNLKGLGFQGFDELLKFSEGQLTVITGIPNAGKSEFLDQLMLKLAENREWRFGVWSAENQPTKLHIAKLIEKYIGKPFYGHFKMDVEDFSIGLSYINDYFMFIKMDEQNVTIDGILKKAKELHFKHGINMLVIDNWATVEHSIEKNMTETQYIGKALSKLFRFARLYNIHVVIVAHPTKIQKNKDGSYMVATMYDIAGSSNWFNKVDNGISVYRDYNSGITKVFVQKVRYKFNGKVGSQCFRWDSNSGRYYETIEDDGI